MPRSPRPSVPSDPAKPAAPSKRTPRGRRPAAPAAGAAEDPPPSEPQADPARPFGGTCTVQLDPFVSAGRISGRFDIMLRGRIVSTETVDQIALFAAGEEVAVVSHSVRTPPGRYLSAEGEPLEERVFVFSLPIRLGTEQMRLDCAIEARGDAGAVHRQDFALDIVPTAPLPARLAENAPRWQPDGSPNAPVPALLYVERALLASDGALTVEGWGVSGTPVVVVQAIVAGVRYLASRTGLVRPDVAQAHPRYGNAATSGFVVHAQLPPQARSAGSVEVGMICREGLARSVVVPLEAIEAPAPPPAPEESSAPVPAADPVDEVAVVTEEHAFEAAPEPEPALAVSPIHMFCDEVVLTRQGWLTASGWALSQAGVARVVASLDGEEVAEAEYGLDRPDVGGQHPSIPNGRWSGFRLHHRIAGDMAGEHEVAITVVNEMGELRTETARVAAVDAAEPEPASEPPPEPAPEQFRFELDRPALVAGRIAEPVTGRLTLEGWTVARSGIAGIEVMLDGARVGQAHCGLARQDVGLALPEWEGAARSGFAFHCPPRGMRDGEHEITMIVRANDGSSFEQRLSFEVRRTEDQGAGSVIRRKVPRVEIAFTDNLLSDLGAKVPFQVLLRVPVMPDPKALAATLASLRAQTYQDWRLTVLCEEAEVAQTTSALLRETGATPLARVLSPSEGAWTAGFGTDPGALYLILDPGDELAADALAALALDHGLHPRAELLYGDEIRISPVSREREAFLKPDFSPDLLLSTNYIGRPWVATGALLGRVAATPAGLAGSGEYDLVLRCAEQAGGVHHVPKVLCERAAAPHIDAVREALTLEDAAMRRGMAAEVLATDIPGTYRMRRTAPVQGKVSIIIPTCAANGYIGTCLRTLREITAYRDFEIVVIDNIPAGETTWKPWVAQHADKVVDLPGAFNWSRFNNVAADVADGEFILFLNDDIEIIEPDWLDAMLEHAARPEVGIVGARLLYPDRKLQHGGMFLMRDGIARHAFRFVTEDDPGYFGLARTQRNVIAVTGACMLLRREVFEALGRFDEAHEIVNNDLDLCLRAHAAGLLSVYTPYATLIHHELASRAKLKDVYDLDRFDARWGTRFAAGDPYFNPRLTRQTDAYEPDDEAEEIIHPGNPLFLPEDIKEILIVKLDHIGDFVTAIPAMRRVRALFPSARLTLLAPRAARDLASAGLAIDNFVEFEFFHTRSSLGVKVNGPAEMEALRARLAPLNFDLAIDLRMQPDTRDVLRYTGARFLAGYDHLLQFPFLDISLSWEGDHSLQRKRMHVSDGLLALVEAVGAAGHWNRTSLPLAEGAAEAAVERLPEDARVLFEGSVVAVHPGVGNVMRQWPATQFSQLIDLLVETDDVSVVLIGGPDEAELAEEVLDRVSNRDRVVSLVGRTPLRDLPGLLASCDLYIGNNSGPKHIAAALGVPTIGIHSGVVDAIEWGPIGPCAVAIRRNMACSPCYLARLDDCPRGLACLTELAPASVHRLAQEMLARPVPEQAPVVLEPVPEWRERAAARVAIRAAAASRKPFTPRKPVAKKKLRRMRAAAAATPMRAPNRRLPVEPAPLSAPLAKKRAGKKPPRPSKPAPRPRPGLVAGKRRRPGPPAG